LTFQLSKLVNIIIIIGNIEYNSLDGSVVRVNIMAVKELLGHKALAMTLRYAHLAPTHKVKALEMLDLQLKNQAYYTIGGLIHKKST
jgi:hypothetical protein